MQKQITIEQLAGYLPYGLRVKIGNNDGEMSSCRLKDGTLFIYCESGPAGFVNDHHPDGIKPYLRPLTSLTKEITDYGHTFVPMSLLLQEKYPDRDSSGRRYSIIDWTRDSDDFPRAWFKYSAGHEILIFPHEIEKEPYWVIQKLLSWHFDIHGLIDSGLALPIND